MSKINYETAYVQAMKQNEELKQQLALDTETMRGDEKDVEIKKLRRELYKIKRANTEKRFLESLGNHPDELSFIIETNQLNSKIERLNSELKLKSSMAAEEIACLKRTIERQEKEIAESYNITSKLVSEVLRVESLKDRETEMVRTYKGKVTVLEREIEELTLSSSQGSTWPVLRAPIKIYVECQICRFAFDDSPERTPKVLQCGHTICQGCAGHIVTEWMTLRCPFDRKETLFQARELPKNYAISETIESIKKATEESEREWMKILKTFSTMVKKATSKQPATPIRSPVPKVVPSKEAKQIQKLNEDKKTLQTELKEARKELKSLQKQVKTEKENREKDKKAFEKEKQREIKEKEKKFNEEKKVFEEKKKLDIDEAILQGRMEQSNENRTLMDKCEELEPRWARSIAEGLQISKKTFECHRQLLETLQTVTQGRGGTQNERLKKVAVEMTKQVEECTKTIRQTSAFCKNVTQIAVTGMPLCKMCLVKCERQQVEVDREHRPDILPTACQICCYRFSELPGQVPRVLRCGHSFCERCIDTMKKGHSIDCPYDRKETIVPMSKAYHLPKNFAVLEIMANMPADEEDNDEAIAMT